MPCHILQIMEKYTKLYYTYIHPYQYKNATIMGKSLFVCLLDSIVQYSTHTQASNSYIYI